MPVYKPESETMGSYSTLSGQAIDNDYSITTILDPGVSTRQQFSIELSISGSIADTTFISSSLTENITTLVVTVRKK